MFETIVLGLFFLLGIWLIGYSLHCMRKDRQARSWPAAPGNLLYCELVESPRRTGEHLSTWKVEVRYMYKVEGKAHEGNRISFGYCGTSNRETHEDLRRNLSSLKALEVHYEPNNPSNSVIRFDNGQFAGLMLGVGMMLVILIGIAALLFLAHQNP